MICNNQNQIKSMERESVESITGKRIYWSKKEALGKDLSSLPTNLEKSIISFL